MNAVMHLPGVCPELTDNPLDQLCSWAHPDCNGFSWARLHGGFRNGPPDWAPTACPGIQRWCMHDGFNTSYESGQKGHGVIMLRQPEQRLMAGYYNPGDHHGWRPEWGKPASVWEYARVVHGVSVKMLSRDGGYLWDKPPTPAETKLAVSRLRDGFAFVGITDEHELSVCLLHAMFGNECEPREFGHFHRSWHPHVDGLYDVSELEGFRDEPDRQVFAEAMRIFAENLLLYNVSKDSCMPCFQRANVGQSRLERIGEFVRTWESSE